MNPSSETLTHGPERTYHEVLIMTSVTPSVLTRLPLPLEVVSGPSRIPVTTSTVTGSLNGV